MKTRKVTTSARHFTERLRALTKQRARAVTQTDYKDEQNGIQ